VFNTLNQDCEQCFVSGLSPGSKISISTTGQAESISKQSYFFCHDYSFFQAVSNKLSDLNNLSLLITVDGFSATSFGSLFEYLTILQVDV
jgi:hypothetical protein